MMHFWRILPGAAALLGLDRGFWASMAAVLILVAVMNAVFWGMGPKKK